MRDTFHNIHGFADSDALTLKIDLSGTIEDVQTRFNNMPMSYKFSHPVIRVNVTLGDDRTGDGSEEYAKRTRKKWEILGDYMQGFSKRLRDLGIYVDRGSALPVCEGETHSTLTFMHFGINHKREVVLWKGLQVLRIRMATTWRGILSLLEATVVLQAADLVETFEQDYMMNLPIVNMKTLLHLQHLSYAIDLERGAVHRSLLASILNAAPNLVDLCVMLMPAPSIESVEELLRVLHNVTYIPDRVTLLLRGMHNHEKVNWSNAPRHRMQTVVVDVRGGSASTPDAVKAIQIALDTQHLLEYWFTARDGSHWTTTLDSAAMRADGVRRHGEQYAFMAPVFGPHMRSKQVDARDPAPRCRRSDSNVN